MDKKNKSKKITCYSASSSILLENNDVPKDGVLFKDIGFFAVVLTALLYMSAYVCEAITAVYYGFDIDLISLPMSTIIKNNMLSLFIIIPAMLPIVFDYLRCYQTLPLNVKPVKKFHLLIIVIIFVSISIGIYNFNESIFYRLFLPVTIISIFSLLFLYFLSKIFRSTGFVQSFFYLFIWIIIWLVLVGMTFLSFILMSGKHKQYQMFNYNNQNYVLLRQYDNNLVAKKIITKELNGQKENCFDNEILYLPVSILEKGLILRTVDVVDNCK
ncbi:hypothetical protein [Gilliamella sp. ESL0254]|uniref:hypothetical protein n=1 Tax=Gilliamella sp. ESL0254 TaxID=2705035 RepID=UPI0015806012|nr:hypothetical protein [Gilliamella sp. ESL0254]NUF27038.1 hypothetical protein [Gilliamella sp. ESL0254]